MGKVTAIGAAFVGVIVVLIGGGIAAVQAIFGSTSRASDTALADIPSDFLTLYYQASTVCPGLDWSVLAAIGKIETNHGRLPAQGAWSGENPWGAGGVMQILQPTWDSIVSRHQIPPGGATPPSRYNPHDAIHAAAFFTDPHFWVFVMFVRSVDSSFACSFTNLVRDVSWRRAAIRLTEFRMALRQLVVEDFRVQPVQRRDGWRSFTIVCPDGRVHAEADQFLRVFDGSGTQRTYAHYLVDHLRWRARESLDSAAVTLRDLERYMGAVGAKVSGPFGEPWRAGKRPYGASALATAAACLKGFYLHHAARGVNRELGAALDRSRLPTRADRQRRLLGHTTSSLPSNPLAPARVRRRHPKMLPDGARERLLETVGSARDRLVVTWLADGGFRIGELCGLHLADLHLREGAACGECRSAHVHVCHRPDNPNRASAKTKLPWTVEDGTVTGGLIKRASPAMIHAYFDYMMTERRELPVEHGMLLVQLSGPALGEAWAPDAARGMLRRAGTRTGMGRVKPHAFRHSFASAVLDASGGNLLIARDAGGWASTTVVDEIYSHVDVHDPAFAAALTTVWSQS